MTRSRALLLPAVPLLAAWVLAGCQPSPDGTDETDEATTVTYHFGGNIPSTTKTKSQSTMNTYLSQHSGDPAVANLTRSEDVWTWRTGQPPSTDPNDNIVFSTASVQTASTTAATTTPPGINQRAWDALQKALAIPPPSATPPAAGAISAASVSTASTPSSCTLTYDNPLVVQNYQGQVFGGFQGYDTFISELEGNFYSEDCSLQSAIGGTVLVLPMAYGHYHQGYNSILFTVCEFQYNPSLFILGYNPIPTGVSPCEGPIPSAASQPRSLGTHDNRQLIEHAFPQNVRIMQWTVLGPSPIQLWFYNSKIKKWYGWSKLAPGTYFSTTGPYPITAMIHGAYVGAQVGENAEIDNLRLLPQ